MPLAALTAAANAADEITSPSSESPTWEYTPTGVSCPVAPDQGDGLGVRKSNAVGGQAVIEGVMMRGPRHIATAVRAPDGRIVYRVQEFPPLSSRSPFFKKPVLRGAGMLYETLKLGIATLDWSSKIAQPESEGQRIKWWEKILSWLALPLGLAAGLALFLWFPYAVAKWTVGAAANQLLYHFITNAVRIALLVSYLWVISLSKEIRRVFEYHGAEHKGIAAYEAGDRVEPEYMKRHSRFHARCGTSFLLVLALVTMLFFACFDSVLLTFGWVFPNAWSRVLAHLPLIPLVAGIGYELLKWSDRKKRMKIIAALIQPGLWLQRITTREPDESQLRVSEVSLKTALTGVPMSDADLVPDSEYRPLSA